MALGVGAGIASGLFGVGGGIVFVPLLVIVLGHRQIEAETTSLLAVVPVAAVGALRQHRCGNLVMNHGIARGLAAVAGTTVGVVATIALLELAFEVCFSALLLFVAGRVLHRTLRGRAERPEADGRPSL
jgi:hypothetical protein